MLILLFSNTIAFLPCQGIPGWESLVGVLVEDVWLVERRKKCEKRKRRLLFYTTHPASLKTKIKKNSQNILRMWGRKYKAVIVHTHQPFPCNFCGKYFSLKFSPKDTFPQTPDFQNKFEIWSQIFLDQIAPCCVVANTLHEHQRQQARYHHMKISLSMCWIFFWFLWWAS